MRFEATDEELLARYRKEVEDAVARAVERAKEIKEPAPGAG